MACLATNLGFIFPSSQEVFVLLAVGIMLFGRRLPEVGRAIGKTVVQLRQSLGKLKEEMAMDEEVAELRNTVRDVQDTVASSVEAPRRAIKDPGKALMDLTDESLSVPSLADIKHDIEESLSGPTSEVGEGESTHLDESANPPQS
jgi:Sec-independent protein translocase protein TatA